jgi:uncharacterized protein YejL (UPF0352 family)
LEIGLRTNFFSIHSTPVALSLLTISSMILLYSSLLSIRASVGAKNSAYFVRHFKKILCFIPIHIGLIVLLNVIISFGSKISVENWALSLSLHGFNAIAQSILVLYFITATLFLIDRLPTCNGMSLSIHPAACRAIAVAFQQALTSIFSYFPLVFTLLISYAFVIKLFSIFFALFPTIFSTTGLMVVNYFFVCAINTFYLKVRHNNYPLFFKKS